MSLTRIQPSGLDSTQDYAVDQLTANTVVAGGVDLYAFVNSAFTTANAAGSSAMVVAAYGQSNTAYVLANAAFTKANTGGSGSGITFTASNTTPATAAVGDQWYNVNEDILYEYINSGTSNTWVDTLSSSISTTSSTSGVTRAQSMTMNIIFGG